MDCIDANEFLKVAVPTLRQGDPAALVKAISLRWRPAELCTLLKHAQVDVRRVAAVTIGLVGDRTTICCLSKALHDPDEQVNQMAEHGLWAIWFRCGKTVANEPFRRGVDLLSRESYEAAVAAFNNAIELDSTFAEAHNQCAIAHFFVFQWPDAIHHARKAVELMPMHFGAMACMGHSFTQLNQLENALACYRLSMEINPRMPAIARMIQRLEQYRRRSNEASGIYAAEGAD